MIQNIYLGTAANNKTGDGARLGGAKINANFKYLDDKINAVNALISSSGFTLVEQVLTMATGWQWKINSIDYTNPAAVALTIPYAATGKKRIDLIVMNTSNTFMRIPGVESALNPVVLSVPVGMLQAFAVLADNDSVTILSFDYLKVLIDNSVPKFTTDLIPTVTFPGSGIAVGETILAGTLIETAFRKAFAPYINPAFTSFSISGQSTVVEVGATLSGSKTFIWGVQNKSGVVNTIDIYDVTVGSVLLAGTPNDGSQALTIVSKQLNADGAVQTWKGIANNSSPAGTIDSAVFSVISRYNRYWGPVASFPSDITNGAANRTYAQALSLDVKTPGGNAFILSTGTVNNKFIVILPPGVTITGVTDQTNANTDITSNYILTATVTINDAGGTPRAHNMYKYSTAIPYSANANHYITTT